MSQRERDVLHVMARVRAGELMQSEAGCLIGRTDRQVRRLLCRLESEGDGGVVHRLRGRASNHRHSDAFRDRVLDLCRTRYAKLPPTFVSEKLAELDGLVVGVESLRGWLLAAGLWARTRRRETHRQRRVRRTCFGEMVQADASSHAWLEDRGPSLTLVGMIDDATSRVVLRFFEAETTAAYMDVLGRWVRQFGRPVSWYSDRHGIFRAEEKVSGYDEKRSVPTQFSRALGELGVELILAGSPQAKGRVERLWGTAQDRLVNELRLAGARTIEEANVVLEKFVAWFNRELTIAAANPHDAHLPASGSDLDLDAILSVQTTRRVNNDYTIRFENRIYQLHPPALPGERGGKVTIEQRMDGTMKVRFKGKYLSFSDLSARVGSDAEARSLTSLSLAHGLVPVSEAVVRSMKANEASLFDDASLTAHQTAGRSGRTPALPYPPVGEVVVSVNKSRRPASTHPWRKAVIPPNRTF